MEKRLLIVDDESRITESFKVLFESRGYRVQTASNGYDAIEIFKQHPFRVVLSDIHMDGMDGIDLMHALKRQDPCVQFIFLTGYANIDNAARALKQNNAFDYLQKPVKNMKDLYKIVEKAEEKYDDENHQGIEKEKNEQGFAIFRDIFDSMESAVYVSDIQTHELIYANKKLLETLEYDDPAAIAGDKCWQVLQKDQTAPCSFCTNNRLLQPDGTPGSPFEWEFCNTVNHRWYHIVDKAIEWYDKRIVRLETALDITEKKEHEKLFREFEKAIETSKKFESISTLAGGVAHDFNNTLSTVIGNINLAQVSCPETETDIQKYLAIAEKGVMQAKEISSRLITFARGGKPIKTKTDIAALTQKMLDTRLDSEKITFSFETDPIPRSFYADQGQLKTAIGNILQNSVDSMVDHGRIDVSIKYQESPHQTPHILIFISDSGKGIPRDHLDMIFNPYFTTKPLSSQRSKGLGLSIAWSIITRHGGDIHLESTVKKGTTVRISLPVFKENGISESVQTHYENRSDEALDINNARILVMDDDELILDVISQLLKRLGYGVITASNGEQAVEIFKTAAISDKKIDMVLLDYDIKTGQDGVETMKQLIQADPGIKGIIVTGHSDNSQIKKYRDYGFSDMLEKPFSIAQLDNKIRALLV